VRDGVGNQLKGMIEAQINTTPGDSGFPAYRIGDGSFSGLISGSNNGITVIANAAFLPDSISIAAKNLSVSLMYPQTNLYVDRPQGG